VHEWAHSGADIIVIPFAGLHWHCGDTFESGSTATGRRSGAEEACFALLLIIDTQIIANGRHRTALTLTTVGRTATEATTNGGKCLNPELTEGDKD